MLSLACGLRWSDGQQKGRSEDRPASLPRGVVLRIGAACRGSNSTRLGPPLMHLGSSFVEPFDPAMGIRVRTSD